MRKLFSFGGKKKVPVFGVPLAELVEKQDPPLLLPLIVVQCCRFIEQSAGSAEGVFRIGVDPSVLEEVKKKIEKKPNVDINTIPEMGPHVASAVLKAFFRQLPDSVCTFEYYPFFLQAIQPNPAATAAELARLIDYLPPANNSLLRFVCAFLAVLTQYSSQTRMNSSSLAQFIGPHLLRPAPSDQAQQIELANADKVSYVMQVMIDQYTAVFRESPRAAIQRLTGVVGPAPSQPPPPSQPVTQSYPYAAAAPQTPQPGMYSASGASRYSASFATPMMAPATMSAGYLYGGTAATAGMTAAAAAPPSQPRFIPLVPTAASVGGGSGNGGLVLPGAGLTSSSAMSSDVQHQFSMFSGGDSHGSLIPLPGQPARRLAMQQAASASPVNSSPGVPQPAGTEEEPDIEDVFRAEAEAAQQAALQSITAAVPAESNINVGAVAGTYNPTGSVLGDKLSAAQEAEQKYRENWRVLKETEKLRRESHAREQQLEREKRALEKQLTELRAAWAAERARAPPHAQSAMTTAGSSATLSAGAAAPAAMQAEMESLRATVAALQRENDNLKRQLEQQQAAHTAGTHSNIEALVASGGLSGELAAELRRMDVATLEIAALLSLGGPALTSSPAQQSLPRSRPQVAGQPLLR